MAIKGLLKPESHVVCSCLDHNAVYRPLYRLKEAGLIDFDIAPVFEDDPENFSCICPFGSAEYENGGLHTRI